MNARLMKIDARNNNKFCIYNEMNVHKILRIQTNNSLTQMILCSKSKYTQVASANDDYLTTPRSDTTGDTYNTI